MTTTRKDPVAARYFMLEAAVARNDARQALRHIYCDGGHIVATNGKMLVFTDNTEQLKRGFYDLCTTGTGRNKKTQFVPVTDEKSKDWNFPNWKQVVPDCTTCKHLEFHAEAEERELEVFRLQFAVASLGTGALIGQEYIDLICKAQMICDVRIIDGLLPVIFEVPNCYSVLVMPRRAKTGKSEVQKLLEAYKAEAVAAAKTAPEPQAESAGEPEKAPEPEKPAEPAQAATEPGPVAAPMPEPVEMPKTRQEARKAAKAPKAAAMPKTKRNRKPTFSYICELEDGSKITLDSIAEVKARRDVLTCRIEPVKKSRKAA